ncbi:hypothetical protein N7495_007140 [Penicillium taxi]|uniref:uncharacterized protein n=1 Tax=Penicillium taxi TaxID=168475 RepID=UPI002544E049|nr:uncharacterized protein N7495_007140 [Penicillium taxi]KAJ5895449.1 hypothetical protein N7495_007140 [Penicillium taxi]
MSFSTPSVLEPLGGRNKKITITAPNSTPQIWIIDQYLSGIDYRISPAEAKNGLSVGFTRAKFTCHLDGNENKKGFLRIYRQIEIQKTQLDTRTRNASRPSRLKILRNLKRSKT